MQFTRSHRPCSASNRNHVLALLQDELSAAQSRLSHAENQLHEASSRRSQLQQDSVLLAQRCAAAADVLREIGSLPAQLVSEQHCSVVPSSNKAVIIPQHFTSPCNASAPPAAPQHPQRVHNGASATPTAPSVPDAPLHDAPRFQAFQKARPSAPFINACTTDKSIVLKKPPSGCLHSPTPTSPPPISSFSHRAAISHADLLEASGSQTGRVDFSRHGLRALVEQSLITAAARMHADSPRPPPVSEVCWFVQMDHCAAPGLPLSLSSTLSSSECVASAVAHYLLSKLEFALLAAAAAAGVPCYRSCTYMHVMRHIHVRHARHAPPCHAHGVRYGR